MTPQQKTVLDALYSLEEVFLRANLPSAFATAAEVAAAIPTGDLLHGDVPNVRGILVELWSQRRVLQLAPEGPSPDLIDVQLVDLDSLGVSPSRLPVEQDDVRGFDGYPWERVAIYDQSLETRYRSRVAEVGRLLALNHQRFRMLPSTGLLRYERRAQFRPNYDVDLVVFRDAVVADVRAGCVQISLPGAGFARYDLDHAVQRDELARSIEATLDALIALLGARGFPPRIAEFQARSCLSTLAGLYCSSFRSDRDGHIVTAGVGSGKSYAFQLGAVFNAAYRTLRGTVGVATLLVYPRVVLASNQFQDLVRLVEDTGQRLGQRIPPPVLDAGGRLGQSPPGAAPARGQKFHAIRAAYQGQTPILISNLDTLANRIAHPEASKGLCCNLDLIVLDEVHLMSGLYGAHGRMFLKRLLLLRGLWRLRRGQPSAALEDLLPSIANAGRPYFLGASATIAEPRHHLARVGNSTPERILHLGVGNSEETGSVHHFFLRQRPEASSLTAAINATSCLIHNRRDGLYHEYYQRTGGGLPLRLDELDNPVLPTAVVEPRDSRITRKTLGFCDSLDGVNRWADLMADNERTKAASMATTANPVRSVPYFVRFQEPLWRVVLYGDLSQRPASWRAHATQHYGALCRDCKRGIRRTIPRVPPGLRQAQTDAIDRLWDHGDPANEDSYLARLGAQPADFGSACFAPILSTSGAATIGNLDACGFFQAGLCWWWSRDHLGSNRPARVGGATPLNGYRKPRATPDGKYHPINGVRVRTFTSKVNLAASANSINDIFRCEARQLLRHRDFGDGEENCALVIGSPSLEVGVDLERVRDGVTFRAMRDPASLQQKVGRVGREIASDSVVVHLVTENARDHFYFRNPRVALDPEYLQPIPLHEDNRIVARNHFFMAIFDFLVLEGSGPPSHRPGHDGDRLMLINDHKNQRSFSGWDQKVQGVFDFLFGQHSRAVVNRQNLARFLAALGADPADIEAPSHVNNGPGSAPCGTSAGAIDVFQHEFGPNFLLTPLSIAGRTLSLATLAAWPVPPPTTALAGPPRQAEFLRSYHDPVSGIMTRSYARDLLTLPVFRRGVPPALPGNQPFLWTPNFFESVGREYVRVFIERGQRQVDLGFEPVTTALALLTPGTVTYRYETSPYKVPVSSFGCLGLDTRQRGLEDVLLDTSHDAYFQAIVGCPPIQPADLPRGFPDPFQPVPVFQPRQVGLLPSWSEPMPHPDGLLTDGDERDLATSPPLPPMATPPRCFALRWYRLTHSARCGPIPDRLATRYEGPGGVAVPPPPRPPVLMPFVSEDYDSEIDVTSFVWGLDRQFMTRAIDPARLVYRSGDPQTPGAVVLGHRFTAPGIRFVVDLQPGTVVGNFLDTIPAHLDSPVYQALLAHLLSDFLGEHARAPVNPNDPPWAERARPSTFVVRNLRAIIWFHLLEQWHPSTATGRPLAPPRFNLDDVVGCFTPGHHRYIDDNRYQLVSRWLARVQNPASVDDRTDTLRATRTYFDEACRQVANLDAASFRRTSEELLLNSLGIALHNAALRVSGASSEQLSYFYRRRSAAASELVLFDSDEFGNGTADLLRRNFHVSAVERVLSAREAALGGAPDPLPTTDFAECLEQALDECASSHASHLAFHDVTATPGCWHDLQSSRQGERQVAGHLFDFLRAELSLASFDDLVLLQWVPEFVAHVGQYQVHAGSNLMGGAAYPTFQALESAFGFCVDGCVACLVSPEQNVHGVLNARESVSKLLLDALCREVICGAPDPVAQATYPGQGSARTVDWSMLASTVASALGRTPAGVAAFTVTLQGASGASDVAVFPATTPGGWSTVFRLDWSAPVVPTSTVRPKMPL